MLSNWFEAGQHNYTFHWFEIIWSVRIYTSVPGDSVNEICIMKQTQNHTHTHTHTPQTGIDWISHCNNVPQKEEGARCLSPVDQYRRRAIYQGELPSKRATVILNWKKEETQWTKNENTDIDPNLSEKERIMFLEVSQKSSNFSVCFLRLCCDYLPWFGVCGTRSGLGRFAPSVSFLVLDVHRKLRAFCFFPGAWRPQKASGLLFLSWCLTSTESFGPSFSFLVLYVHRKLRASK